MRNSESQSFVQNSFDDKKKRFIFRARQDIKNVESALSILKKRETIDSPDYFDQVIRALNSRLESAQESVTFLRTVMLKQARCNHHMVCRNNRTYCIRCGLTIHD